MRRFLCLISSHFFCWGRCVRGPMRICVMGMTVAMPVMAVTAVGVMMVRSAQPLTVEMRSRVVLSLLLSRKTGMRVGDHGPLAR